MSTECQESNNGGGEDSRAEVLRTEGRVFQVGSKPAPLLRRASRETDVCGIRLAEETGLPYEKLIDLYLLDCAKKRKKMIMKWVVQRRSTREAQTDESNDDSGAPGSGAA